MPGDTLGHRDLGVLQASRGGGGPPQRTIQPQESVAGSSVPSFHPRGRELSHLSYKTKALQQGSRESKKQDHEDPGLLPSLFPGIRYFSPRGEGGESDRKV